MVDTKTILQREDMERFSRCLWKDCDGSFDNVDLLYKHIEHAHIGFKRHNSFIGKCQWNGCDSYKESRTQLRMHIISHINIRKHKCKYCAKKSFKWKQDLEKHVTKNHKLLNAISILGFTDEEIHNMRESLNF